MARPVFDPDRVATVDNLVLRRDAATLTLLQGQLAFSQALTSPAGREQVFHAAFQGTGRLHLEPSLPLERQQLAFHSGKRALVAEFTEAVFLFTDDAAAELESQVTFHPGEPSALQKLCHSRLEQWSDYGLNLEGRLLKALLAEDPSPHALFVAALKTREHDWLTLIVDKADPEEVELGQFDTARKRLSFWTKFPTEGRRPQDVFADPTARHEYLIEDYTIDVTIDGTELQGQTEIKLVVRRPGERVLLLALDPNLRVSAVTNATGEPLAFFQPKDPKDDFPFFGDYLVLVSPQPFPPGAQTLRFTYAGKRVVRKVGEGNFFCRSFGWYPTYGTGRYSITTNEFAGRYNFDITFRVDKKYDLVATGKRIEERKEGKQVITRWQSEIPLAVAGFAFGDYKIHTVDVGDTQVQIYANKRPDDFMRSIELIASGPIIRDPGTTQLSPLTLGSLSPSRLAEEMGVEMGNALKVFQIYFGDYPYQKLAVANIPYSYGQGWPSLLYISSLSFLDSNQRHQLGIDDHVWLTDFFRAHETSHQWWGHVVGWKSYHDQWLSEGFAEYSGILYTLHRRNPNQHFTLLRQNREQLMLSDEEGATYDRIGPIYLGRRLSSAKHPGGYSSVVYRKGGWVLHMLRMMLYDPRNQPNPDAAFIAMMKDFTQTYFNQPASTEDFKAIVEKHMTPAMNLDGNGTMDWFFNSWVYGVGIPEYRLTYGVEPGPPEGPFVLRGKLYQSNVPEDFRTIVPLFLHTDKGYMRAGWLSVNGPETPFELTLPFKPTKVTISEWEDVLAIIK
ncbi:MAG TPA: M1 family aminopeptidase [Candidatus Acidoferrales bacterium]|nr:M1 family aminopeptidase [Candidatus Acidoferrales bacterium]